MENLLHIMLKETELNVDLKVKPLQLGADCMWLVYFESVVNFQETIEFIWNSGITPSSPFSDICNHLTGNKWSESQMKELHQGRVAVLDTNGESAFSFQGKPTNLSRGINSPDTEYMPLAPAIAFTEPLAANIGLLRKAVNSQFLIAEGFTFAGDSTKKASIIYHAQRVDKELLKQIRSCLQQASNRELKNDQNLTQILGFNRLDIIPPYYKTELPLQATSSLMEGRVLLFIDGEPIAYVLPFLFNDLIALEWDKQLPLLIMLGLRCLRLLSLIIALLAPGLYVALVSVNPETLRIELALSVASSRIGIPLPTFLEMLLLIIVSEISIEATQRLPKVIGASVTLTSGIVLGTAIVDAKLVSSLVIIVLSISVTANFAFPNYLNSLIIRKMKIGILILSGMLGVFGMFAGFIAICFYVCGLERFGIPFMSFLDSRRLGQPSIK
ncbi:spore germination protein [Paenibacillus aestuarii]|uniref:Spore germination protein n=1 Tax=Paenibacillus aestuarii TaxID=516965 RepID=A0ABW0KCU8_9BACL|nr:spore germination protein [Paenibacillus aestuarii]